MIARAVSTVCSQQCVFLNPYRSRRPLQGISVGQDNGCLPIITIKKQCNLSLANLLLNKNCVGSPGRSSLTSKLNIFSQQGWCLVWTYRESQKIQQMWLESFVVRTCFLDKALHTEVLQSIIAFNQQAKNRWARQYSRCDLKASYPVLDFLIKHSIQKSITYHSLQPANKDSSSQIGATETSATIERISAMVWYSWLTVICSDRSS